MPLQFRLSVCLSHACIVSKRLNVSSKFFYLLIGSSFYFLVTKGCCVNLGASPPMGAPNTRGSDFRPICGYISETVRDRGILWKTNIKLYVLYQMVPLSMTLSDPEPHFHSLKANISQTVHPVHSMFGSRPGFSGSADRMALFAVR